MKHLFTALLLPAAIPDANRSNTLWILRQDTSPWRGFYRAELRNDHARRSAEKADRSAAMKPAFLITVAGQWLKLETVGAVRGSTIHRLPASSRGQSRLDGWGFPRGIRIRAPLGTSSSHPGF
jgi:hypothetical protein